MPEKSSPKTSGQRQSLTRWQSAVRKKNVPSEQNQALGVNECHKRRLARTTILWARQHGGGLFKTTRSPTSIERIMIALNCINSISNSRAMSISGN